MDVCRKGVLYMCDSHDETTHNIDWAYQNQLNKEWKEAHPEAEYIGWTSI
jgi:hypothetical protein